MYSYITWRWCLWVCVFFKGDPLPVCAPRTQSRDSRLTSFAAGALANTMETLVNMLPTHIHKETGAHSTYTNTCYTVCCLSTDNTHTHIHRCDHRRLHTTLLTKTHTH